MKTITFDFETTSTNPTEAEPLTFGYIFYDNDIIVKQKHFSMKVLTKDGYDCKQWKDFSRREQESLMFNGINDNLELQDHNLKSTHPLQVLKTFLRDLENFGKFDYLEGFNIKTFDIPILDKLFLRHFKYTFSKVFLFETRDILQTALKLALVSKLELPNGLIVKAKLFTGSKAYSTYLVDENKKDNYQKGLLKLENLHRMIYGKKDIVYHNALYDCVACHEVGLYLDTLLKKNPELLPRTILKKCLGCGRIIFNEQPFIELKNGHIHDDIDCIRKTYENLYDEYLLSQTQSDDKEHQTNEVKIK